MSTTEYIQKAQLLLIKKFANNYLWAKAVDEVNLEESHKLYLENKQINQDLETLKTQA